MGDANQKKTDIPQEGKESHLPIGRVNLCSDVPKVKKFISSPWYLSLVNKVSKKSKKGGAY